MFYQHHIVIWDALEVKYIEAKGTLLWMENRIDTIMEHTDSTWLDNLEVDPQEVVEQFTFEARLITNAEKIGHWVSKLGIYGLKLDLTL